MLTLNDIGLSLPTPEIRALIDRNLSLDRIVPYLGRSWPGPGNVFLALPTGYRPWRIPRLGELIWPTGACRPAQALYLIGNSNGELDALHDAAFGTDGTELNSVKLVMDSPDATTGESAETLTIDEMYIMALIPIERVVPDGQNTSINGMYLLYLCDDRIFWWDTPCPDFGITETGDVIWQDVFDAIADALDVTITVSDIPDEYLAPGRALNLTHEPIPQVFDAAAANIGCRVVVKYDNSVYVQSFTEASSRYQTDNDNNPGRAGRVIAGDLRYLDAI